MKQFFILFVFLVSGAAQAGVLDSIFGAGSSSPKLLSCQDQAGVLAKTSARKLPKKSQIEFTGQFVIQNGENCSNQITSKGVSCQICLDSSKMDHRDKVLRFAGPKELTSNPEYYAEEVRYLFETKEFGQAQLNCSRTSPRDYSKELTALALCESLSNMTGTKEQGITLKIPEIKEVEAQLRPGDGQSGRSSNQIQ